MADVTDPPLTRGDCVMIARAIREGWDVPAEKREQIQRQIAVALDSDNPRLVIAVGRLALVMQEASGRNGSPSHQLSSKQNKL